MNNTKIKKKVKETITYPLIYSGNEGLVILHLCVSESIFKF